jgi:hypothetical protein
MPLTNMKLTPTVAKETLAPSAGDAPEYPYGLKVELENDALEKLGITSLPDVGTPMVLTARVEVCGVSAYESTDQEKRQSLSLQITDMALAPEPKTRSADDFYPTMKRG